MQTRCDGDFPHALTSYFGVIASRHRQHHFNTPRQGRILPPMIRKHIAEDVRPF
jgi:hypothetical protein